MSVIAFDGQIVAADTAMSRGGRIWRGSAKKMIVVRKTLRTPPLAIACVGEFSYFAPLIAWYLTPDRKLDESFPTHASSDGQADLIICDATGTTVYESGCGGPLHIGLNRPYTAGSGGEFAEGALMSGSNAYEAVCIAADTIMSCGPPVEAYDFKKRRWIHKAPTPPDNESYFRDLVTNLDWIFVDV